MIKTGHIGGYCFSETFQDETIDITHGTFEHCTFHRCELIGEPKLVESCIFSECNVGWLGVNCIACKCGFGQFPRGSAQDADAFTVVVR